MRPMMSEALAACGVTDFSAFAIEDFEVPEGVEIRPLRAQADEALYPFPTLPAVWHPHRPGPAPRCIRRHPNRVRS